MSILLKALKKSEAQRQVGQPPDILAPADDVIEQPSRSRGWMPVVLLLIIAGLMGFYGWQYFFPPEDGDEPAVASSSGEQQVTTESPRSQSSEAPVQSTADGLDQPPAVVNFPSAESRDNDERRQRLNQSFAEFEAEDGEEEMDSPDQRSSEPPTVEPAGQSEEEMAENLQDLNSNFATVDSRRSADEGEYDDLEPVARPRTFYDPSQAETGGAGSEPISFWQVPQNVRDRMPEFRITVLVFAEAPEDRFLLINGERLQEQEELEPGITLDEIRRDGAVFTFRTYRFLVKG